jgi:hypothetical protein
MKRTANILGTTAFVAFALLGFSMTQVQLSHPASVQMADDVPTPTSSPQSTDSMGWQ